MSKKIYIAGSSASFSNPISVETDGVNEFINFGGSLINASQGSVSMWVKILASPATNARIFSSAGSGFWAFGHDSLGTNEYRFFIFNGAKRVSGTVTLSLNTWYHIVCSWRNPGNVKIYVNAVPSAGVAISANVSSVTTAFYVGGANLADHNSNCRVNLWEAWNIQLSDAECTELYNGGTPIDPSTHSAAANLTHSYRSGNGDTYPTITDHTGSSNGTMTNMEAGDFVSDAP